MGDNNSGMRTLNKVLLIGRLGKDPEIQHFESGTVKASFPLATNEVYTDRAGNRIENTDWHNIVMWRGLASIAEKYLHKGSLIFLEGKIKTRSWDDKDGNKRFITEIEATDLSMLDGKPLSQNAQENHPPHTDQMPREFHSEPPPPGDDSVLPF